MVSSLSLEVGSHCRPTQDSKVATQGASQCRGSSTQPPWSTISRKLLSWHQARRLAVCLKANKPIRLKQPHLSIMTLSPPLLLENSHATSIPPKFTTRSSRSSRKSSVMARAIMRLLLLTTLTLRSSKLAQPSVKVHQRDSTTCQMASATGLMVNNESLPLSSIICLIRSQKTHLWMMRRTSTQWCSSNP